jgi:hypothetical protein
VYFKRDQIDQEIASLDSNLMVLPLGEVEWDLALAKRKKLYEQKHPETRQYATKEEKDSGSEKSGKTAGFAIDTADTLGINRRTVERAVERATKSSPSVVLARREGTLKPSVVNELVKLPPVYQDKVLSVIKGKSVGEVRQIVKLALERDADFAVARMKRVAPGILVSKTMDKLGLALRGALKRKSGVDMAVVEKAKVLIAMLEKFVEQNTPVHKPILRKASRAELSGTA